MMQLHGPERRGQLSRCFGAANKSLLTGGRALVIMQHHISVIGENREAVGDKVVLGDTDRRLL